MRWQHFWNTADVSRNHKKSAAGGFQDGDAERLSQTGVQKDVSAAKDVSDFVMRQSSEQLNAVVQVVVFNELLKFSHAFTVSTDNEVDVLIRLEDFGNDWNE